MLFTTTSFRSALRGGAGPERSIGPILREKGGECGEWMWMRRVRQGSSVHPGVCAGAGCLQRSCLSWLWRGYG